MRALVTACLPGIALLAGCADFEDPTIVLDLRVIAMQTDPPATRINVKSQLGAVVVGALSRRNGWV